ncbi:hypothetical protein ACM66B_002565 [Microbotryomycetes sp. NB124-2]
MLAGPSRRLAASLAYTSSSSLSSRCSSCGSALVHTAAVRVQVGEDFFQPDGGAKPTSFARPTDLGKAARGPSADQAPVATPPAAVNEAGIKAVARGVIQALDDPQPCARPAFWEWSQVRVTNSALFERQLNATQSQKPTSVASKSSFKGKGVLENEKTVKSSDDLLKRPPQTETELYRLLVRLGRSHSSRIRPEYMAWFHSQPQFAILVSNRTYAVVLSNLFRKSSNLQAVDSVLKDMEVKKMFTKKDGYEHRVAKVLLQGAMLRGHTESVGTILDTMRSHGWGGVNVFNWRRNLGSQKKGQGDREHEWRQVRPSTQRLSPQAALSTSASAGHLRQSPSSPVTATLFEDEPMALSPRLKMISPFIPSDLNTLTKEDVTMLVESLVQRGNDEDAFAIAEEWLHVRHKDFCLPEQPPKGSTPDCPAKIDLTRKRYNTTAAVLLNILLKGLVSRRTSLPELKTFIKDFVDRHSLSPDKNSSPRRRARRLVPRRSTLRTLLTSSRYKRHAWKRAESIVKWFYETFGVATNEADNVRPLAEVLRERRKQIKKNNDEGRVDAYPTDVVDAQTAVTLLQVAIDNWKCFAISNAEALDPSSSAGLLATRVRTWWHGLDKVPMDDTEVWSARRAKEVEAEAIVSGLLDTRPERERVLSSVLKEVRKEEEVKAARRTQIRAEQARLSMHSRKVRRAVA